ncbi:MULTISPECIES: hypothetical protein [Amycolatopsis]|uniref:Uncharacterized protein n=1 Tax=Amycolatopsis albidoflavus TaxID=102226 RepID=A0ABW5I767_9PSEU
MPTYEQYEPIPGHRLIVEIATTSGRNYLMAQCSCEGNLGLPKHVRESPEEAVRLHDEHCDKVPRDGA